MKKRILSILLSVALCLSLLPAVALAADGTACRIGKKSYSSLEEAIADVLTDGTETTIKLSSDIDVQLTDDVGSTGALLRDRRSSLT